MKIGLDTSFVVPLIAIPSSFHDKTWTAFEHLKKDGAKFVVASHVLLESFAVLTRVPEPMKMLPQDAERALREAFRTIAQVQKRLSVYVPLGL